MKKLKNFFLWASGFSIICSLLGASISFAYVFYLIHIEKMKYLDLGHLVSLPLGMITIGIMFSGSLLLVGLILDLWIN